MQILRRRLSTSFSLTSSCWSLTSYIAAELIRLN